MLDAERVCRLFGLPPQRAVLTPVARGAVGRIWRLDLAPTPTPTPGVSSGTTGRVVRSGTFAVKELFGEPDLDAISTEVAYTSRMAAAGVPLAVSLPAPDGRFVVDRLRLSEWVEGQKADPAGPDVPDKIGGLLGALHANAPRDESEAHPWYWTVPDPATWQRLADRAHDAPWGPGLAAVLDRIAELSALITPMDPGRLLTSHCDLHPDNVLVTEDGSWVPLDWECLGPADPDRELAKLLLDWLAFDGDADGEAVARTITAYRSAGGPGRIVDERAFGMAIAADLNFLHLQANRALDPDVPPEHRNHATLEIDESLHRLPPTTLLSTLVSQAVPR